MKILVICLRPFLGEILFITPALHALRRAYPCATIEALVERKFHEVVLHNPHLDKVIAMDKRGRDAGPRGHLRIIGDLRRARYDWQS